MAYGLNASSCNPLIQFKPVIQVALYNKMQHVDQRM